MSLPTKRFIFFGLIYLYVLQNSITAQTVDCCLLRCQGNNFSTTLINRINNQFAGEEFRINRRKRLRLNRVFALGFDGCSIVIMADVTLRRRFRRNATGTIRITVTLSEINLNASGGRACLTNPKIDQVRLSRTLRIGGKILHYFC